jgi:hypothetical protein
MVSFHRLVLIVQAVVAVAQEAYPLGLVPMVQSVYSHQFLVLILHMLVVAVLVIHREFMLAVEVMLHMVY